MTDPPADAQPAPGPAAGEPHYREPRPLTLGFAFLAVPLAGLWVYVIADMVRNPENFMPVLLLTPGGLTALFCGLMFSRYGPELAHVRVDDAGVWVRRHCLPAGQIGKVWALPGDAQGAAAHFSSRIDGMWLLRGICSYSYLAASTKAVYVEQRRPDGARRPWLIGTHHPYELAAAVRDLRVAAGGPRAHPDDRPAPDHPDDDPAQGPLPRRRTQTQPLDWPDP